MTRARSPLGTRRYVDTPSGQMQLRSIADARLEMLDNTILVLLRQACERLARPVQEFLMDPTHPSLPLPAEGAQL